MANEQQHTAFDAWFTKYTDDYIDNNDGLASAIGRDDAFDMYKSIIAQDRQIRGEPVADCWSNNDGDSWGEHPADADFVDGLKVGDEYELQASVGSWTERFRVIKAPDDTSDDYEVEPVSIRTAPQPAEPVKVVSNDEIMRLWLDHMDMGGGPSTFARALLARYGHAAQPAGGQAQQEDRQ